jgi:putative FmdB family regulatory protein
MARTLAAMPLYDYRCVVCDTTFESRRPMAESGEPATCPNGHDGARRLLSVFASVGATDAAPAPSLPAGPMGGGCGGACACRPG